MRICVISPFVDRQHGTERVLAEDLERFVTQHQAEILLYAQKVKDLPLKPADEPAEGTARARIEWHKVSSLPGPHLLQFVFWYLANQFVRWRDTKLHDLKPDLVYSPGINAPDADAITVHIVFHAFYEQVRERLRLRNSAVRAWPRLLHRLLYYKLIMALEKRIYPNNEIALSAVSQLVADQLKRFFGRRDVLIVRNAVDAGQFNADVRRLRRDTSRASFQIVAEEFVFLLIGNDWSKKGVDALLIAATACGDLAIRILVVGDDAKDIYVAQCKRLSLEMRVTFLEPSADVMQFYAAADAYVGPSLEDAYGLPILEAMSCGLPVIASAAAGVSEIIVDGKNGLILRDPRNSAELATLLRKLATSPEFANWLGQEAQKTAAAESWDAHADRMFAHFEEVSARKKQRAERG